MNHSFNTDIAKKYGIEEAILIENIAFWLGRNLHNNKNVHNGKVWVYNTSKAFQEIFYYMSDKTIARKLKKLEELGVLESGNYNKMKIDRTKWYTIVDCNILVEYKLESLINPISQNEKRISQNEERISQNEEALPIINTIINTDINPKGISSSTKEEKKAIEQELRKELKETMKLIPVSKAVSKYGKEKNVPVPSLAFTNIVLVPLAIKHGKQCIVNILKDIKAEAKDLHIRDIEALVKSRV